MILGAEVKTKKEMRFASDFGEIYALVRKGHEECGDSALVYADSEKVILAVFDGVSGEKGAAKASSDAAKSILESLKSICNPGDKEIHDAVSRASMDIREGFTTIAMAFISHDGSMVLASVGDSAIYSKSGKKVALELPLGRAVAKGDSVLKFFGFRNFVTSVIGPANHEIEIKIADGKIKKGNVLILASDGLVDNLYVETKDGYVTDASGSGDLGEIIKSDSPKTIVKDLDNAIRERIKKGKIEEKGRILDPKTDDLCLIALRWAK
ncbi:protein phosphatase 2C domain-containing protein [Candidatus Micrarchaeota archaeon]|nr:protein phosphatase 2C domain-containing protein [Candidatus Micrarchaeota archaeon]